MVAEHVKKAFAVAINNVAREIRLRGNLQLSANLRRMGGEGVIVSRMMQGFGIGDDAVEIEDDTTTDHEQFPADDDAGILREKPPFDTRGQALAKNSYFGAVAAAHGEYTAKFDFAPPRRTL
jgi:hypothetical protein